MVVSFGRKVTVSWENCSTAMRMGRLLMGVSFRHRQLRAWPGTVRRPVWAGQALWAFRKKSVTTIVSGANVHDERS
jgi:hypothetical protein